MNRQLALKLVSKMQTNVWNLTDKQAKIILGFLESDNKRSEQLPTYDVKQLNELVEDFENNKLKIETLLQMIWDRAYVEGMLYERHYNK